MTLSCALFLLFLAFDRKRFENAKKLNLKSDGMRSTFLLVEIHNNCLFVYSRGLNTNQLAIATLKITSYQLVYFSCAKIFQSSSYFKSTMKTLIQLSFILFFAFNYYQMVLCQDWPHQQPKAIEAEIRKIRSFLLTSLFLCNSLNSVFIKVDFPKNKNELQVVFFVLFYLDLKGDLLSIYCCQRHNKYMYRRFSYHCHIYGSLVIPNKQTRVK